MKTGRAEILLLAASADRVYMTGEEGDGYLAAPGAGKLAEQAMAGEAVRGETAETRETLARMEALGWLRDIGDSLRQRDQQEKSATVFAEVEESGAILREALAGNGVTEQENGALAIVVAGEYLEERVAELATGELAGRAWMPVKFSGSRVWIGPVFRPGGPAEWGLLTGRLRERYWVRTQLGIGSLAKTLGAEELHWAAAVAAREAGRWLVGENERLERELVTIDRKSLLTERHPVAGGREMVTDGLTGVVGEMQWDAGPEEGPYSCEARHGIAIPPAGHLPRGAVVRPGICSGRGWTKEAAERGCVAEGVERYSLLYRGDEPVVEAIGEELGENAVEPNRLLLLSDRQLAAAAAPEGYDARERIGWRLAWSLSRGRWRYVPAGLCSLYYRPAGRRWMGDADSTGCGAGETWEAAVLNGMRELIERDALGIWWYNGVARREVRGAWQGDWRCRRTAEALAARGMTVQVLDITHDLGVPVYVALAKREDGAWYRGSACHPDGMTALQGALLEAWQLSFGAERRDAMPAVAEGEGEPVREREGDTESWLRECREAMEGAGLEVMTVDQTRAELGYPVARVVAPGMRPSRPRFAAGRLFEVPARMGWEGRAEEAMPMPAP